MTDEITQRVVREKISARGPTTTEYARAQDSAKWGTIAMFLGLATCVLGPVAATLAQVPGIEPWVVAMAGALVAGLGQAERMLSSREYIKQRGQLKTESAKLLKTESPKGE